MTPHSLEQGITNRNDNLRDVALRRMLVRGLGSLVISESDEGAMQLASELQAMAQERGEQVDIAISSSHDEALREAGLNGSVAIVPSTISLEALRQVRCVRLINQLETQSAGSNESVSLVASLKNILNEATTSTHKL